VLFQEGIIYTNVSSILVSVNPFKLLPLYTPEIMDKYRVNSREQPPHVFQVLTCVGTRVSVRCRKSA
jgi:myosin heavy subunit